MLNGVLGMDVGNLMKIMLNPASEFDRDMKEFEYFGMELLSVHHQV